MKLYFIAGENSGDFIGAKVIKAIKTMKDTDQGLSIGGIGGYFMEQEGISSLFSIDEINMMGFLEIIPHIFRIKKLIDMTALDIIAKNPDILITIDSPGFTYRVAQKVRKIAPHIKLCHIVAPSVWAYKPSRAKKYAKLYDHLLTLLPFEPPYFTKHGLKSTYIGHPVLEQDFVSPSANLRKFLNIPNGDKVISITPGSRKGEILRHMKIIKEALNRLSTTNKITAIFVQSDERHIHLLSSLLSDAKFNYIFSTERLQCFAASDCALAKSGTNTLEIAASGVPMIVGYKLNPISFMMIKAMIKIKFACLINIIAGKEIIPEYLQSEFTESNISLALSDLLLDPKRGKAQVKAAQDILQKIGFGAKIKPSEKAAKIILGLTNP